LVGCLARPAIEAVAGKHMLLVAEIVVDAGYREVGSLRDSNAADEPLDVDSVALAAADLGDARCAEVIGRRHNRPKRLHGGTHSQAAGIAVLHARRGAGTSGC